MYTLVEKLKKLGISAKTSQKKVIDLFDEYLLANTELYDSVSKLQGKTLGCWCSPEPCHGEILHRLAGYPTIYQIMK